MPNPISPVLEFIENDGSGTFLAHFGWNNPGAVTESEPVGDANKFTPAPQDRGQPVSFAPGRHRDQFRVPFTSGNLVWTLRGRTSTAAPAGIILVFNAVTDLGNGLKRVTFGYRNDGRQAVLVKAGINNLLSGPVDVLPTELFLPGAHPAAFSVEVPTADAVSWEVLGLRTNA